MSTNKFIKKVIKYLEIDPIYNFQIKEVLKKLLLPEYLKEKEGEKNSIDYNKETSLIRNFQRLYERMKDKNINEETILLIDKFLLSRIKTTIDFYNISFIDIRNKNFFKRFFKLYSFVCKEYKKNPPTFNDIYFEKIPFYHSSHTAPKGFGNYVPVKHSFLYPREAMLPISNGKIIFDNGYGCSISLFNPGEYEIAATDGKEKGLNYETKITNDVISGLKEDDVTFYLIWISILENRIQ